MLNRLRAGTHLPSREVLGAILRAFGTNTHVRDLVLHFLEHEMAQARHGRLEVPKDAGQDNALMVLDAPTRTAIRAFVRDFLRRSLISGAGLDVVSKDASVLRGVVAYVRTALDDQGVASVVIAGNAPVAASLRERALAAPLLIVERVDFASESVRALIAARAAVRKPVLTTATDTTHAVRADVLASTLSIPSPPSDVPA